MPRESGTSTIELCERLRDAGYPDFSTMNAFEPSKLLPAPTFASFSEIVAEDGTPKETARGHTQKGLFEAYLGDPRVLYYELIEDPSRFEDGVSDLVQQLVGGMKQLEQLSPAEKRLLDRATLSWAEPRHRPSGDSLTRSSSTPLPVKEPPATYAEALEDPDIELEYREHGAPVPILDADLGDISAEAPPTFWWVH